MNFLSSTADHFKLSSRYSPETLKNIDQLTAKARNKSLHLPFFFYSLAFSTVLNSNVDILVKIGDSSC